MKNSNKNITVSIRILWTVLITAVFVASSFGASPGWPDATFGDRGRVTQDFGSSDNASRVAFQPDGKMVVVGRCGTLGDISLDFCVARYNIDGSLDTTFSGDGLVRVDINSSIDSANSVDVMIDGRIVVGGSTQVPASTSTSAVIRLTSAGNLDTTFDTDGEATFDAPGNADGIQALRCLSNGQIIGAGGAGSEFFVARIDFDGSLDNTFSGDGFAQSAFASGGNSVANSMLIDPDGKIIVSGVNSVDFAIARFTGAGVLDTTFSGDGMQTIDFGGADDARALVREPSGRYVIAGSNDTTNDGFAIARLNLNGALDTTFDGDGRVVTTFTTNPSGARFVGLTPSGRILVGGRTGGAFTLVQYNSNGSIDTTFDGDGIVSPMIGALEYNAFQNGDKLVVTRVGTQATDFDITQLNLTVKASASADFDGDAVSDYSVFRPSTGQWFVFNSSTGTFDATFFGLNGDRPIDGDFDGDGRADLAVFRPSTNTWFRQNSSNGAFTQTVWGAAGDRPVPGDIDADGKTDIAIWRPSDGNYYFIRSSNASFGAFQWGQAGDIPIGTAAQ